MNDITKRINKFIDYFSDHIERIQLLPNEQYHLVYKKLLYVAALDGLSKSVFTAGKNRERFIGLLRNFSKWEFGDHVSLTHLSQLLSIKKDPAFEELSQYVQNKIISWFPGEVVTLDRDPHIETIIKLWPTRGDQEIPFEGVSLESLTHLNLLYTYRNFLVHELRAPGFPLDDATDYEPAYIYLHSPYWDSQQTVAGHWILIYPIKFFHQLCKTCITNLWKYYLDENIDPSLFYNTGFFILDALNE